MPTKKAAEPARTTSADRVRESSERNRKDSDAQQATTRSEFQAERDLNAAQNDAVKNKARRVKADPDGDIDQRMAALLEDHKRMGAR